MSLKGIKTEDHLKAAFVDEHKPIVDIFTLIKFTAKSPNK